MTMMTMMNHDDDKHDDEHDEHDDDKHDDEQ